MGIYKTGLAFIPQDLFRLPDGAREEKAHDRV